MNKLKGLTKTYIVHIYRQDKDNPDHVVGTVEDVLKGVRKSFRDREELWKIMGLKREKGDRC